MKKTLFAGLLASVVSVSAVAGDMMKQDIEASNGLIHVIDSVILPNSALPTAALRVVALGA